MQSARSAAELVVGVILGHENAAEAGVLAVAVQGAEAVQLAVGTAQSFSSKLLHMPSLILRV